MISLQQLRVFSAIAREGSLGAAARVLGCTQPTVSHHLASLERELRTAVVVRESRGVALTDRGRVLIEHADRILQEIDAAERAVESYSELRAGVLRIGAFSTAAASFMPRLLTKFRERYPGVRLTIREDDDAEAMVTAVRAGELDLAFLYRQSDYLATSVPGLAIRRLFTDPMHIAVPPTHCLADRTSVGMGELADDEWISARSNNDPHHRLLLHACRAAGYEPKVVARGDSYNVVNSFLVAGLGIALVPQLALPLLDDNVGVLEVAGEPIMRHVQAATLASGASSTATVFLGLLRPEPRVLTS